MHPLFLLGKAGCSHPPPPVAVCLVRGSQAPTGWAWGAGTCNYQPNPPSVEAGDGAQPTPPLTLLVATGKGWDGDKDIFLNSLHADPQQRQTAMLSHLHAPSLLPLAPVTFIQTGSTKHFSNVHFFNFEKYTQEKPCVLHRNKHINKAFLIFSQNSIICLNFIN